MKQEIRREEKKRGKKKNGKKEIKREREKGIYETKKKEVKISTSIKLGCFYYITCVYLELLQNS